MATRKDVMNYLKLSVQVETQPGNEIQDHIKATVLGTPGKIRYRHTSFAEKFPFLGKIYFLILLKSDRLLGSVAFSLRDIRSGDKKHRSWYIRYFSIRAPLRDATYKRKRAKKSEKPGRDNLLKTTADPFFSEPDQLAEGTRFEDDRSLIYAYVEKDNLRSWNFSESVGFETVGKIRTVLYSRFKPKKHPEVHPLAEEEKDFIRTRLLDFYKDYNMYTDQNIFYNDQYLVWKENGRIVAGCQANPEMWDIIHIPGFLSKVFLKGLTRLPYISKRFDPKFLKFVAFEGIWYDPEYETCLLPLIESALSLHNRYLGMLWLDGKSHVMKLSDSLGKRGLLYRFFKTAQGDIRVKFINWKEKDIQEFSRRPSYLSCFDMT